jgi:4-diphosphocytidyl-2-C-methyl-D-erythritol kinase
MIFFPGCKINIGLNVINKRPDGYHNLESIFYPLLLSDVLEIIESDHFSIQTTGLPIDGDHSDNLIVKAYYLLQDVYHLPPIKIHLHKQVPMGAGLGGGSADGTATLLALNQLFDLKIPTLELERLADQLGSDCSFFVKNKPLFVQGKGEIHAEIELDLSANFIQLIHPSIHISTKEAFSGIGFNSSTISLTNKILTPIESWKENIGNDFEHTIFPNHPEIAEIKDKLYQNDAIYASMTGTGSAVYGIFKNKPNSLINTSLPSNYFEWISHL